MTFVADHKLFITVWLGAVCTFAIYSILYRENRFYRLFEHIFIGLAAGQGIALTWTQVLKTKWWDPMFAGHWVWIFALVAGFMWYFIYSERFIWISRLIMGLFMGMGAGGVFQGFAHTYIPQIYTSFKPLAGVPWYSVLNNFIFIGVLLTVMAYFFFSIDHKAPAVKHTAATGRWLLMFAFGAMFGSTVMARMSLFIGRMNFLINDWAPKVPAAFWWMLLALAIIGVFVVIQSSKTKKKHFKDGV